MRKPIIYIVSFCVIFIIFSVLFGLFFYFNDLEISRKYELIAKNSFVTIATYKHNEAKGFPDTPAASMYYVADNGKEYSSTFKCDYKSFVDKYESKVDTIIISKDNRLLFENLKIYQNHQPKKWYDYLKMWHIVLIASLSFYVMFVIKFINRKFAKEVTN